MSKPHVPCVWKRLAGRPTGGLGPSPPTSTRCKAPSFAIGQSLAPWIIRTRYGPQSEEKAACALHVEAPGGSTHGWRGPKSTHQHALYYIRSRPFVSAGPFCRGSFPLGTGRSPRRKPHVPCMWKRLAGRPTGDPRLVLTQVHPPARAVRSRPFVSAGPFCRGSFALGTGRSPRRKPHVHCMWKRLAAVRPRLKLHARRMGPSHPGGPGVRRE